MNAHNDDSVDASWADLRCAMPVARQWAYFDHAAVAPLPEPARAAMVAWADDMAVNGDTGWNGWEARLEDVRAAGARLLGADAAEIALVRNTTEGITLVAEGFPWRDGDNVVTLADEFPSNQYPWMNLASRGVACRRVEAVEGRVDLAAIERACDARTRIIAISWVNYAHGWRNDLDALVDLAHGRRALLFVDAIQGLGVFPLDVRRTPIDFLAADGHKWLLGPEGAGLFYLRREHLGLLRPIGVGWNSVRHGRDYSRIELAVKDSAARYEGGSYNMAGFAGLASSMELLGRYRLEDLSARVLAVTDDACERLARIGATISSHRETLRASGIVAFDLPGRNLLSVKKQLLTRHVVISFRGGRLRISPHAYSNEEDLERLIAGLEAVT
ncbi:MAG: aminotransferase class V-fold PLP-dependent enzyme [Planctomycetia bacterium]|nr:aminotransferase class V-fold PLP-dependent enzyme [Planctomycetia bacterium]